MSQAITNKILKAFEEANTKQKIELRTKASLDWFSNYIQRVGKIGRDRVGLSTVKDVSKVAGRIYPGNIFLYTYDPKTKEDLPYYDTLPLVIVTSVTKKGWYGLNMHYLPPIVRKAILAKLYDNMTSSKSGTAKIKISWEIAQAAAAACGKSPHLKHCIKQYLRSHVKSSIMQIDPDVWDMVAFLPLQRFQKATTKKVWGDI